MCNMRVCMCVGRVNTTKLQEMQRIDKRSWLRCVKPPARTPWLPQIGELYV